jgi:hypothetical protein
MNNNEEKSDKKDKKDFWDISKIVVTLLFTTIGGGMVGGFTALTSYQVRVQEINLKRIETVEKFMPYLVGEINGQPIENSEIAKENAIIVIASLGNGNEELAINLARFNPSEASITILGKIVLKLIPLKDSDDANSKANSKDTSEAQALALDAIEVIGEIGKNSDDNNLKAATQLLQSIATSYEKQSPKLSEKATEVLKSISINQYPANKKLAIVIGSDTNLQGANYEKQQAEELLKNTKYPLLKKGKINIYKRKQWYATVVEGIDQDNKDKTLESWQTELRPSSFVIDFNDWCKKKSEDKGGYFECE